MSKPTLFLHIGTYKTGSSSIQHTLYRKQKDLESEGIIYLSKGNKLVEDELTFRQSEELNERLIKQARGKLASIIKEKGSGGKVNFLSSAEEYSGEPNWGFRNADVVAKSLGEITKGFDLNISVIVYLRRQDDFYESLYTQRIRYGNSFTFDEFLTMYDTKSFNWDFLVRSYADVFGRENINVRIYHKNFLPEKESLIHDFGKQIGSNVLENCSDSETRNKGISRDTLEIFRLVNPDLNENEKDRLRKLLQQSDDKKPFDRYSFFEFQDRLAFLERYRESNENVARDFLNNSLGELFPEPTFDDNAPIYQGLTTEAVTMQLLKTMLQMTQNIDDQNKAIKNLQMLLSKIPGVKFFIKKWLR